MPPTPTTNPTHMPSTYTLKPSTYALPLSFPLRISYPTPQAAPVLSTSAHLAFKVLPRNLLLLLLHAIWPPLEDRISQNLHPSDNLLKAHASQGHWLPLTTYYLPLASRHLRLATCLSPLTTCYLPLTARYLPTACCRHASH